MKHSHGQDYYLHNLWRWKEEKEEISPIDYSISKIKTQDLKWRYMVKIDYYHRSTLAFYTCLSIILKHLYLIKKSIDANNRKRR
jgi:hypothetical protein